MSWVLDHLWTGVQLAFAGAWAGLLHKGLAVTAIAVLVGLAYGSQMLALVPMVGELLADFFKPLRKDLLWGAFGIAIFLAGQFVGSHDTAAQYAAKTVVIENVVEKAVKKTKSPAARAQKDPFDSPEN